MIRRARSFLLIAAVVVMTLFIAGCELIFEQQPQYRYGNFARTVNKYRETTDWEAAVRSELGAGWRVADWNDLKNFYNNGGNLVELLNALGITEYRDAVWLTKDSQKNYETSLGQRYYFAERHNGSLPSGFQVHDNLGNYLLTLGSWINMELPILAYKK